MNMLSFSRRTAALAAIPALAFGLLLGSGPSYAADFETEMTATDRRGVPADYTADQWLAAEGRVTATADGDQHEIRFEGSNLAPDGLYTFWAVRERLVGMDVSPAGGVPDNEFRADSDGNAEASFRIPADSDYHMIVLAYHADDQTHGDEPGEMGEVSFEHLIGAWPGPEGRAPDM
jgi:hypothetical protein